MVWHKKRPRDTGKPGFSHCSRINIELREKKVRCNRELLMINKKLDGDERQHLRNMRKFDSAQRGVMLLIGESPYPDCTREDAIFLYNQPGFCYRRDGNPRYFSSLYESKSRKILSDMDGKEGLQPNPALNVVSDTPTLAEILSSPEIVQILCELRNTAALMTNEQLLQAFAEQLEKTHRKLPFFKEFQGPLDYLKQYRRNLIQEFFDTLKTEAEMRLFVIPVDPTATLFSLADMSPLSSAGNKSSSATTKDDDNRELSTNSHSTSRASTNKEEDASSKNNETDINKTMDKDVKKFPVFGGIVPPPPPLLLPHSPSADNSTRSTNINGEDSKRNDSELEQESSTIQDSVSNHMLDTTDFIPTSKGYMTVEDWNMAVLEQLRKSQAEEATKRLARTKIRTNKNRVPPSAENQDQGQLDQEHNRNLAEESSHQPKQIVQDLKDDSAGNFNSNGNSKDPDSHNNLNNSDNSENNTTEELRKQVAAAVAAEEEAKYRLDQKIMGLAGITSLYKSSNIGFAKYFEYKDELREKELKIREKSKHTNKRKGITGRGDGSAGWLASVHDHQFNSIIGNANTPSKIGGEGKITDAKFTSSTNTLTDSSSVGTKDTTTTASVANSKRRIILSKRTMKRALNSSRMKSYQRQEFDTFVRGLIRNIEEISAVDRQVSGLSKRRPVALQGLINPLVRLLKRDNLFDTLNEDDVFFSEFEGGKKELEKIVAAQLPATQKTKSRGFVIKLPSKTSTHNSSSAATDGFSETKLTTSHFSEDLMNYPFLHQHSKSSSARFSLSPPFSARSSSKPSSAASSKVEPRFRYTEHGHHHYHHPHGHMSIDSSGFPLNSQVDSKETCWICPPRSLQRVCCAACRAKAQQACSSVLRRDKNCKVTMSLNSWKIPGMQPPNWKRNEHLTAAEEQIVMNSHSKKEANKIPAKLRKFYESTYPIPSNDHRSRSVFLEPPTDMLDVPPGEKHAAPTPVYLKKRLYPLPAVLTNVPFALAATAFNSGTDAAGMHRSSGYVPSKKFVGAAKSEKSNAMFNIHAHSALPPHPPAATMKSPSLASGSVKTIARPGTRATGSAATFHLPTTRGRNTLNGNYSGLSKGNRAPIERLPHGQLPMQARRSFLTAKEAQSGRLHPLDSNSNIDSWTLKVSKFDILKLRHELDGESVKEKMKQFEALYLRRPNST